MRNGLHSSCVAEWIALLLCCGMDCTSPALRNGLHFSLMQAEELVRAASEMMSEITLTKSYFAEEAKVRYSLLTTHYSLLTTHYSLPTTHYPLLTTHYPLPTTHYPLPTTHYSLPTTHYWLLTTHYSLPTTHYSLPTTHYSLQVSVEESLSRWSTFFAQLSTAREHAIEDASRGTNREKVKAK